MHHHSFRELGVSQPVVDALAARSILHPFEIQELVLPDALAGLDILARSPTGSGKTLAFAVPIVERVTTKDARPSALVLVPTRELAAQVGAVLHLLAPVKGLTVATVYGGVPLQAQAKKAAGTRPRGDAGRLEDLVTRRLVDISQVRTLVLDEADRMLDMGFQPQVDKLVRRLPRNRQTMFFSATLDGAVRRLARAYTNSPSRFDGSPQQHEPADIEHSFVSVTFDTKLETLVRHLEESDGLTLVFVRTKRGADQLVKKLARQQVDAVAMHGDMSQRARERSLARFEEARCERSSRPTSRRAASTSTTSRTSSTTTPAEHTSYVHRTGRTGRAGRGGNAITFVLPDQQADTSHVARRLGHGEKYEEAGLRSARRSSCTPGAAAELEVVDG